MNRRSMAEAVVFGLLVAYAVASRLLSEVPNFHAVAASALFAGFFFRSKLVAVSVPLAAMLLTDPILGMHAPLVMASVYACLALPVAMRPMLGARPTAARVAGGAIISSTVFFLLTNLAHWYAMLPHTWATIARCYTVALPFFGRTLAGDLAYALALFGAYRLMRGVMPRSGAGTKFGLRRARSSRIRKQPVTRRAALPRGLRL